jgi:hypothetical protein
MTSCFRVFVAAIALATPTGAQAPGGTGANVDWPQHNLDLRNGRYAALDEINTSNAARLAVKWSYDAGAVDNIARNTPLVVDGVMYVDAGSKLRGTNAALLCDLSDRGRSGAREAVHRDRGNEHDPHIRSALTEQSAAPNQLRHAIACSYSCEQGLRKM